MGFVLETVSYAGIRKKKFQKLIHALFIVTQLIKQKQKQTASDDMGLRHCLGNEDILKQYILYI